jgi:serine/threonine protein kinase
MKMNNEELAIITKVINERFFKVKKIKEIGSGAYGTVFKVTLKDDTKKAVKYVRYLDEDTVKDVLRELIVGRYFCKAVNGETTPVLGIERFFPVMDADHETVTFYMVSDYIDGTTLKNMIYLQKRILEPAHVKMVAFQILNALRYLEQKELVHGDLKPENVMVGINGDVTLLDFGKATSVSKDMVGPFDHGAGTSWYSSISAITRKTWYSGIDRWAAGCILFEMIVGKPLFYSHDDISLLVEQCKVIGFDNIKLDIENENRGGIDKNALIEKLQEGVINRYGKLITKAGYIFEDGQEFGKDKVGAEFYKFKPLLQDLLMCYVMEGDSAENIMKKHEKFLGFDIPKLHIDKDVKVGLDKLIDTYKPVTDFKKMVDKFYNDNK